MSGTSALTKMITRKQFQQIENDFHKHFDIPLETVDMQGRPIPSHCSKNSQPRFCKFVCQTRAGKKRCHEDRIRSMKIAFETGQPYTTLCHAGILESCVPVMNNEQPLGGIFLGQSLPEPFQHSTEIDMEKRLFGLKYDSEALFATAEKLPLLSSKFIHDALEMLYILLYNTTSLDPRVIRWKRHKSVQQARISEAIHHQKLSGFTEIYPFESERELIAKVRIGDKTGAREILNSILGSIMFCNPGQMDILKVRLVELLSILSRSASESGIAPEILLKKNADYINKVISLENQEEICAWISLALNDFIDCVYEFHQTHKNSRLKPAMEYIQNHYKEKITLYDIAKAAYLSSSRLCHLFRDELNTTAFKYLNATRIQRAKYLLLSTDMTCIEVCFDSGFANLSFFNRTFKQQVGMSPSKFRKNNQR